MMMPLRNTNDSTATLFPKCTTMPQIVYGIYAFNLVINDDDGGDSDINFRFVIAGCPIVVWTIHGLAALSLFSPHRSPV